MHLHFLVTGCRGRKCQLSAPNVPDEVQISECPSCVRGCIRTAIASGLFPKETERLTNAISRLRTRTESDFDSGK